MRRLTLAHSSELMTGPRLRTESQLHYQESGLSWQIYSPSGCLVSTLILMATHQISGKNKCDDSHPEKAAYHTINCERVGTLECLTIICERVGALECHTFISLVSFHHDQSGMLRNYRTMSTGHT